MKRIKIKNIIRSCIFSFLALTLSACSSMTPLNSSHNNLNDYVGRPYATVLPGILEAENFDLGGEGVAYHDTEASNEGTACCANKLRVNEGPDINMIKDHDYTVDGSQPRFGARYLGWIRQGEWIRYTVDVPIAGEFTIGSHLSSAGDGNAMEIFSGDKSLAVIEIPSTGDVHTWMEVKRLATVHLDSGIQVLTLKMIKGENWNLDNLEFIRVGKKF